MGGLSLKVLGGSQDHSTTASEVVTNCDRFREVEYCVTGIKEAMNKTVVWTVAIIVVGLVFGIYIYSQNTRYYIQSSAIGNAYKIDRKTGRTWMVAGGHERLVKGSHEAKPKEAGKELSREQINKLTGRANLSFGNYYSGSIHNGNDDITVHEVVIKVKTTANGEEISRTYVDEVHISPRTTADFGFGIIVGDKDAEYSWSIVGAKGGLAE